MGGAGMDNGGRGLPLGRLLAAVALAGAVAGLPAVGRAQDDAITGPFHRDGWSGGSRQAQVPYCYLEKRFDDRGYLGFSFYQDLSIEITVTHSGWQLSGAAGAGASPIQLEIIGGEGVRTFTTVPRSILRSTLTATLGTIDDGETRQIVDRLRLDRELRIRPGDGSEPATFALTGTFRTLERLEQCARALAETAAPDDGVPGIPPVAAAPEDPGETVPPAMPVASGDLPLTTTPPDVGATELDTLLERLDRPVAVRVRIDAALFRPADPLRDLRLVFIGAGRVPGAQEQDCELADFSVLDGVYDFRCPDPIVFDCGEPAGFRLIVPNFAPLELPACDTMTIGAAPPVPEIPIDGLSPTVRFCVSLAPDEAEPACAPTTGERLWAVLRDGPAAGRLPVDMAAILEQGYPDLAAAAHRGGVDLNAACAPAAAMDVATILEAGDSGVAVATTCGVSRIAFPPAWPQPRVDRCIAATAAESGSFLCLHDGPLDGAAVSWGEGWAPSTLLAVEGGFEAGRDLRPTWPQLAGRSAWPQEAVYRLGEYQYCLADGQMGVAEAADPQCCLSGAFESPEPLTGEGDLPGLPPVQSLCGGGTPLHDRVRVRLEAAADAAARGYVADLPALSWSVGDDRLTLPDPLLRLPLVLRSDATLEALRQGPYWDDLVHLTVFDSEAGCRETPPEGEADDIVDRWLVPREAALDRVLLPEATARHWARLETNLRKLTDCAQARLSDGMDTNARDGAVFSFDFDVRYSDRPRVVVLVGDGARLAADGPALKEAVLQALARWMTAQDPADVPISLFRQQNDNVVLLLRETETLADLGADRAARERELLGELRTALRFEGTDRDVRGLWEVLTKVRDFPVRSVVYITDQGADSLPEGDPYADSARLMLQDGIALFVVTGGGCQSWYDRQFLRATDDAQHCLSIAPSDAPAEGSVLVELLQRAAAGSDLPESD